MGPRLGIRILSPCEFDLVMYRPALVVIQSNIFGISRKGGKLGDS